MISCIGSLFVENCRADHFLQNFETFVSNFNLDANLLMNHGIEGPIANLSFQRKRAAMFGNNNGTSIKYLGAYKLRIDNNTSNVIAETNKLIDINQFSRDVHFFFKVKEKNLLLLVR